MPTVSILIPAYRPDYLDLCIASALAQTHTDFELLISDDSGGEVLESIVSKWQDPRIRYVKNPNLQMPGANRDNLLSLATGKYAKFLFDDDLLLPRSVELLLLAIERTGAKLAFHNRHIIDARGQVTASPVTVSDGGLVELEPEMFFDQFIGQANNFIGEPTNILIDLETLRSIDNPFGINNGRMRFLTDVALYTNFASRNHKIAGIGYMGAAIRRHAGQYSDPSQPLFSAGLFEWELFMRWAMAQGRLKPERYQQTIQGLHNAYQQRLNDLPELEVFLRLQGKPDEGGYFGPSYREALSVAYMTLELKRIARKTLG